MSTIEPEHLIDIASYNAVSDWKAVRANGIVGASIKVSQQVNYLNPLCGAQVAGARSVGIAPGGYHFGDPRVAAATQAEFFVNNARPYGLFDNDALAPMYDAENWEGGGLVWPSPKVLNSHITEHIRVVREETGVRKHLVYGSLSWWQTGWLDPDVWADDDVLLWIAVYNGDPGNLQGWSHPNDALHQHTSSGIVPGVAGNVDKNVTLMGRRISDLINQEDDLSAEAERQIGVIHDFLAVSANAPNGQTVHDAVWAAQRANEQGNAAVLAAVAETTTDSDITLERLQGVIATAVTQANEATLLQVGQIVKAELGADNSDLAAQVVDKIGRQLTGDRPNGGL